MYDERKKNIDPITLWKNFFFLPFSSISFVFFTACSADMSQRKKIIWLSSLLRLILRRILIQAYCNKNYPYQSSLTVSIYPRERERERDRKESEPDKYVIIII